MQLIVQKKGYRILPLLALAVAMAALIFIARDTQAVHTDGLLEMDGNVAFDGGDGVDPGTTPCPYPSTTPRPNPVDCIGTVGPLAAFDWEGLCERTPPGTDAGLIRTKSSLPSPSGATLDDVT